MASSAIKLDLIYIGSSIGCFVFFFLFFNYCNSAIVATKQLSFKLKSPIFTQMREIMRGLIPIQMMNQSERFMEKMINSLNTSLKGSICFFMVSRVFALFIQLVAVFLLMLGMGLSSRNVNKENNIEFGFQLMFICRMIETIITLIN